MQQNNKLTPEKSLPFTERYFPTALAFGKKVKALSSRVVVKMESVLLTNEQVEARLERGDVFGPEMCARLMKEKRYDTVCTYIKQFYGIDHKDIALKLIEAGVGWYIVKYLEKFEGLDHKDIALKLIEGGIGWYIAKHLDKFEGLDHKAIALRIIDAGSGWAVLRFIEKFKNFDMFDVTIRERLFPSGMTEEILRGIEALPDVGMRTMVGLAMLKKKYPNVSYVQEVKPFLDSQGVGAFRVLELMNDTFPLPLDFFVGIAKRGTTQAYAYMNDLALPLVKNGYDFSQQEQQSLFYTYMKDIGIVSPEIYTRYVALAQIQDMKERENAYTLLQETIRGIQDAILGGRDQAASYDQQDKELFAAVLYTTFPPATGLGKNEVYDLYTQRKGREQDVKKVMKGHETQIAAFSEVKLKTGMLTLASGEELDMKHWVTLSEVIREVHKEKESLTEDLAQVGKQLVSWYMNPSEFDKKSLWKLMYTHEVLHGRTLAEQPGRNVEALMQYKEFIGDRIKSDYVREAMEAYRKAFPVEYGEFLTMVASRIQLRNPQAIAQKLWGMARQYREKEDPLLRKKFEERWEKDYGLTVEEILGARDEKELGDLLVERSTKDLHEEATRLVGVNLVKDTNNDMRRELDKFSFHEDAEDSGIPLHFEISKRKAHGFVGLNMGVCVAPDQKLWDTPEFMNVIAFDTEKKVAMGGMHFYFVDYEGKRYLSLPGINPSLGLLSKAEAKEVYETFLTFAKKVAKELGCAAVWIPERGDIHSNRSQIQSLITGAGYTEVTLNKTIPFSYDPHTYDYDKVYEISWGYMVS